MEGVRILTQSEVVTHVATPLSFIMGMFIIFSILSLIVVGSFFVTLFKEKYFEKIFIAPMIFFICVSIGAFYLMKNYIPTTYETQYLVEVTDADFVEFYNKYKVIEDKGNGIYLVAEKEHNNERN